MSIFTAPPHSGLERHAASFSSVKLTLWHGKQWQGSAVVMVGPLDLHDDAQAAKSELLERLRETQADLDRAVNALAAEVGT